MMDWLLILILVGRLSGSTSGIATASFGSEAACQSLVSAMNLWSEEAGKLYPTDTPYVHAYCAQVAKRMTEE